ncbi:MAG TPA: serine/threonine-protein kinase, partial [Polyangiaceae bacterium]|nr:serine/threonine-protein kinase [Polyangiaceae bacterium]
MTIPPEAANLYPEPGTVIDNKYRCERLIGAGGIGAVALATHLIRKAPVALKFMHPGVSIQEGFVERFINEAVAASRIDSEHVVKVFDVGQLQEGTPYLVMEYLEGIDLADVLERDGAPGLGSIPRCLHFAVQILRGLQTAHDAGIVHRDMKPSNCFVIEKDGDPDFVKLLDFGISKLQQPGDVKLTQTNSLLGTPLYMSPEQSRSAKLADHRTDLYAVGVIIYELLTGKPPFDSDSTFTELLLKIATEEPIPLREFRPDVPEELAAVIRRAFARNPNDRYGSAYELSEALAPWCDARSLPILEGARRRAARITGLPHTMLSSGTTQSSETAPAATGYTGVSAPEKTQAVVPASLVTSQAGVAAPAMQGRARSPSRMAFALVGVGAMVLAAAALWFFSRPSAQDTPPASLAVSVVEHTTPPPPTTVTASSAPIVVVAQETPSSLPSASASV